jgi:hypothetical protein
MGGQKHRVDEQRHQPRLAPAQPDVFFDKALGHRFQLPRLAGQNHSNQTHRVFADKFIVRHSDLLGG